MAVSSKIPRLAYLIPLAIIYFTVEQLHWLTPFISVAIVYVLIMGVLFFLDRKMFSYPFIPWWLLFSIVMILNSITGDTYFSNIISVLSCVFFISFSAIVNNYCNNLGNEKLSNHILTAFFISVVYLTICSFILDINQPGVLRYATGKGYGGDHTLLISLYLHGMSNYYLPHALPILIPPLVMGIKNKQLSRVTHITLYVLLAVILVLIYISYATTPLIIALLFIVLSVFVKQGDVKSNIGVFVFIALIFGPFLLSKDFLMSMLSQADTLTGGEGELHSKILMFQDSLTLGEATGDMEERLDLYNESASFLKGSTLLFGTNEKIGGHSAIIDIFSSLGLIGFIPFVLLLYKQIKYTLRFIPKPSYIYYYLSLAAGLLMLLSKSMNNWEMWIVLFCIMPLLTIKLSKD